MADPVRLTAKSRERIRARAAANGRSFEQEVDHMLECWLRQEDFMKDALQMMALFSPSPSRLVQ